MSRQFDEYIDGKIEFEGDYYALVEPTNLAELCEALRVKDIIQTAIDRTMPEDADYLYEKQEEQDGYINDYISSLGEFSNRILTSNIAFLTKKSGIRTGDLEKMLGLSTGYISRTAKDNAEER